MTAKGIKLEEIKELMKSNVHMKNREAVEAIINKIIYDGKEKLQVISDFDFTMTKQHINGKRNLTSFGIFGECSGIPPHYKEASAALYKQYRPVEIDASLTKEQKIPAIIEWYEKADELFVGHEFDLEEILRTCQRIQPELRDGTHDFLKSLLDNDIPVLVFSAGLGDVVSAVLEYHGVLYPNLHIISNFLLFEEKKMVGFKGPIIHSFNKNEHAVENCDYFKLLTARNNVLLFGDVVGDAEMSDGVKNPNAILKIGFLYEKFEENLEAYLDHFDIVLVDDQSMDVGNAILKFVD